MVDVAAQEENHLYRNLLVALSAVFLVVKWVEQTKVVEKESSSAGSNNMAFVRFQRMFVGIYLIMMTADWLQGPTVYKLYQHYGFTHKQNGQLFIAGFGSSMIFGTFAGADQSYRSGLLRRCMGASRDNWRGFRRSGILSVFPDISDGADWDPGSSSCSSKDTIADKYGRKLCCIIYGISYSLCCITKHFNNYNILMVGRILGGFSTSILWSAFESWMVSEHLSHTDFNPDWMGNTFSLMIAGNGLVAIASGFAAQGAVELYNGHPVAPFDLSLACLVLGTVLIMIFWKENYGDAAGTQSEGLMKAINVIYSDSKVFLLGLMQSLFEGAMYTFVFVWTPVLEETGKVDHGFVFAAFMISCSIGATVFSFLNKYGKKPEGFMFTVFLVASLCMSGPVVTKDPLMLMCCFCLFEVCVGIFWPSIMSMRSRYLPEEGRATIMNIFRIPLNAMVCLVLSQQDSDASKGNTLKLTFMVCAAFHAMCCVSIAALNRRLKERPSSPIAMDE